MASGMTTSPSEREHRTIILPVSQEHYGTILSTPAGFRQWIDENYERYPELFPVEMEQGYRLNGSRTDKKNSASPSAASVLPTMCVTRFGRRRDVLRRCDALRRRVDQRRGSWLVASQVERSLRSVGRGFWESEQVF